ncbi:DUF4198 domain-containing protein [Ramlibacter sp. AW1]|uniref:DUF4198 domain-containing protein n=1 Tax=Ramlibacter aurantiacus TaxID=2801330 RepID=A0A936ZJ67_9BURK|nr:DUF4198 domain-containing protein [Ramlibacter aurantiacus]MBL0421887.1 DUF4198 domain-containing protein [Ramlibacter aurantiacus]
MGRVPAGLCALTLSWTAYAHDSWLSRPPGDADARLLQLELATGPRFPLRDSRPGAASLAQAACRGPGGAAALLTPRQEHPDKLELRARLDASGGAACWVELKPHQAEMTPELVDTYFREIRPAPEIQARWAQQRAKSIAWRETYRKFIRIELPAADGAPVAAALRQAQGLALEIVPMGSDAIRVGQPTTYQVFRDGAPLAGQWLEFVNDRHALGVWRQSDAQGQVRLALPFAGRWLLRATQLEMPEQDTQPWRSRFATLLVHAR